MVASGIFFALFAIITLVHLGQAIYYRKFYCWVVIMSALWQTIAYAFRTASIVEPDNFGPYATWFVLILVAPLWVNAFVYMVFGRMVWNYTDGEIYRIKAWKFGFIFVVLDVIAFIIQIWGAITAIGKHKPPDEVLRGLHIYMGGVGIQLAFILGFSAFCFRLHHLLRKPSGARVIPHNAFFLFYVEIIALILIVVSSQIRQSVG